MNLGMGMELRLNLSLRHAVRQSHELKLSLKLLLEQRLELQEERPPKPTRGLEGLRVADAMLKEQQACGILIGGMSEAVWKRDRSPEQLAMRKDVDVLVLSRHFKCRERFEGGIDWWLPMEKRLRLDSLASSYFDTVRWWQNCNFVPLVFTAAPRTELSPGLHFLSREDILEMRWLEATFKFGDGRVKIECDIDDLRAAFRKRLERFIGLQMPKFLRAEFGNQIHYEPYGAADADCVSLECLELERFAAVRKYIAEERG